MWWIASNAFAVGGALVGPPNVTVLSEATQLSVAPTLIGTTFVITAEVSVATDTVALLWPMDGVIPSSVIPIEPLFFGRIEPFTRGRVETFTCDELVTITHWPTPPGCASYPVAPIPPPTGEPAADSVGIDPIYADVDVEAGVVAALDLPQWLLDRGLVPDPAYDAVLQVHIAAGTAFLAVRPVAPMAAGTWIPPVQFSVPSFGPHALPLTLGAAVATTEHQLVLYGVAPADDGALTLDNYPRGFVEDDCMLPSEATGAAGDWWTDGVEALRVGPLPAWVLVHGDRPDSCQPCVTPPLEAYEIADFGGATPPEDTIVSRIEMAYTPAELIDDPVVSFDGSPADVQLRWIERDPDLEFAFATCGELDAPASPGVCPQIDVQRASAGGWLTLVPLAGIAVLVLAGRRRLLAAGVVLLCVGHARAAETPVDRSPRAEIHAGLAVVGTDRLVPEGIEGGAPYALNPYLAIEGRWALLGWRDGANVGPLLAVSGWTGHAAPGAQTGDVNFTLIEPSIGIDARHGRISERGFCPLGRYGASLVFPLLGNSVTPTELYTAFALHGGIGAWLGRGRLRPSVELRARVLPRTDGFETTFHENVGIPGWMFFPGTANLWVMLGLARL